MDSVAVPRRLRYSLRQLLAYVTLCAVALVLCSLLRAGAVPLGCVIGVGVASYIIGVILASRGRLVTISGVIWAAPIAAIVGAVLIAAAQILITVFTFGGEVELKGVSYQYYARRFDTSTFDPVGASNIWLLSRFRRDHGFVYMRMSLDEARFNQMMATQKAMIIGSYPACYWDDMSARSIRNPVLQLEDIEIIQSKPAWWNPKTDVEGVRVYVLRCKDLRGLSEDVQALWFYEPQCRTLSIVHNGQVGG
jgi:hypothetical protein